jgi:DNA-binding PadR family transcriptional regulator
MFHSNGQQNRQKWYRHQSFNPWSRHGFMGFGASGATPSRFERGDLKYVILDLLKEKPRHGYDIITDMEKRFHGFYTPSPGSVYPILQLLEDQGLVISNQQAGKKVYSLTQEGETFLSTHKGEVKEMYSRLEKAWDDKKLPEIHELIQDVRYVGGLVFRAASQGELTDPEKIKKIHDVIRHGRREIESILGKNSD